VHAVNGMSFASPKTAARLHGGYTGIAEEFMSASPLPLTDIEVSKKDGAMYVSIGGRKVQSGLYRVTYVGNEDTMLRRMNCP
jgi:hypothetical protein